MKAAQSVPALRLIAARRGACAWFPALGVEDHGIVGARSNTIVLIYPKWLLEWDEGVIPEYLRASREVAGKSDSRSLMCRLEKISAIPSANEGGR
ncbi:MAG: hypothetical protein ACJ74Z_22535 [Bryobacteraceae bacterium]